MENPWRFQITVIKGDEMIANFHNVFRVVNCKGFVSKSGKLPNANKVTIRVLYDDTDYGVDKKTGEKRLDNVGQNIDVYILNTAHVVKRGDYVALKGFDSERSYVSGFDMWLFFADIEVVAPPNAAGAGKGNN